MKEPGTRGGTTSSARRHARECHHSRGCPGLQLAAPSCLPPPSAAAALRAGPTSHLPHLRSGCTPLLAFSTKKLHMAVPMPLR